MFVFTTLTIASSSRSVLDSSEHGEEQDDEDEEDERDGMLEQELDVAFDSDLLCLFLEQEGGVTIAKPCLND